MASPVLGSWGNFIEVIHCRSDEEGIVPWIIVTLKSLGNVSFLLVLGSLCKAQLSCSGCKTFNKTAFHC